MTTETEGIYPSILDEGVTQIRNDKVTQIAKACNNCRHVAVCGMYSDMGGIIKLWDSQNEVKFPFKPEILAQTCPHYESPLDVIKLAEQMQEARSL